MFDKEDYILSMCDVRYYVKFDTIFNFYSNGIKCFLYEILISRDLDTFYESGCNI